MNLTPSPPSEPERRRAYRLWHELLFPLSPLHLQHSWRHLEDSSALVQQLVSAALTLALRQGFELHPDDNPFG